MELTPLTEPLGAAECARQVCSMPRDEEAPSGSGGAGLLSTSYTLDVSTGPPDIPLYISGQPICIVFSTKWLHSVKNSPIRRAKKQPPGFPASTTHREGKWANLMKARVRLSEPSFPGGRALHSPAYQEGKPILKPPKIFFF